MSHKNMTTNLGREEYGQVPWIKRLRYGSVDWSVDVVQWQPGREYLISKLYLVGWQIDKTMSQEVSEVGN